MKLTRPNSIAVYFIALEQQTQSYWVVLIISKSSPGKFILDIYLHVLEESKSKNKNPYQILIYVFLFLNKV